ncbi:RNA polymerase sigma factor [Bacteroides sp. 224]|uniref:RNA polymerase sigma factor n=1 Tax=Bacteroides sp. 224 TaxID=2302936 RepID=UPI0013D69501|nr:sigma-70 family RNA polymerase sigma factor [Bacteroides sp. 224]NDV66592.1 sigma-70 family RNA polymerase sigma factor [Bacteroides sp. 224]
MKLKEFKRDILPLRDKLFRIALRITCNQEEAEDIVQDVMLKMWQIRDEWDTIESKDAYCCIMSRNFAFGRLKLKDNQTEQIDVGLLQIKEESIPSTFLEQQEESLVLKHLIGQLPGKEKAIVELREFEEMSYKEIAQTLELTESQVKINLFRARQKIKELFMKFDKNNYFHNS